MWFLAAELFVHKYTNLFMRNFIHFIEMIKNWKNYRVIKSFYQTKHLSAIWFGKIIKKKKKIELTLT